MKKTTFFKPIFVTNANEFSYIQMEGFYSEKK